MRETSTDVPLIWFDGQSGSPEVGNNILSNPGFEDGLTSWAGSSASLQLDTANKAEGNYGCRVYNRTALNSLAYQDIRSQLLAGGQGGYSISAWAKLASGSDNAFIEVYITDSSGGHRYIVSSSTLSSDSFTKVEGTMHITWNGTLQGASLYLLTQTSTSDLYLDNFHMSKYSFQAYQGLIFIAFWVFLCAQEPAEIFFRWLLLYPGITCISMALGGKRHTASLRIPSPHSIIIAT